MTDEESIVFHRYSCYEQNVSANRIVDESVNYVALIIGPIMVDNWRVIKLTKNASSRG